MDARDGQDLPDQEETQTGILAETSLKDQFLLLLDNALAVVAVVEQQLLPLQLVGEAGLARSAAVADGVVDQVMDCLLYTSDAADE